jgi:dTDP-4-dehydrorhamnose reductase
MDRRLGKGHPYTTYNGSVTDLSALRAVSNQERPSACVHLAGLAHASVSRDELEVLRRISVSCTLNAAKADGTLRLPPDSVGFEDLQFKNDG